MLDAIECGLDLVAVDNDFLSVSDLLCSANFFIPALTDFTVASSVFNLLSLI